jgi:hypothetical protein
MRKVLRDKLVLDAMEAYVEWRQASVAVDDAYRRWSIARSTDPAPGFAAYASALNAEELASIRYAEILRGALRMLARDRRRRARAVRANGAKRRANAPGRRNAMARDAGTRVGGPRGRGSDRPGGRGRARRRASS